MSKFIALGFFLIAFGYHVLYWMGGDSHNQILGAIYLMGSLVLFDIATRSK